MAQVSSIDTEREYYYNILVDLFNEYKSDRTSAESPIRVAKTMDKYFNGIFQVGAMQGTTYDTATIF